MKFKVITFFLLFLVFSETTSAKVKLPSIFSNGMVLQQNTEVKIWGKSNKTVVIIPSWDNKSYQAIPDKDGSWKIKIKTPSAGGPYNITLNDGEETKLSDILIGEVWLASGQSNMEMPLAGFKNQPVLESKSAIANSENPQIRFFDVKNVTWKKPLEDCVGKWVKASPATSPKFSAVAYFYAKILHEKLNVPVGIVAADWGGTLVQTWMSANALSSFEQAKVPAEADESNQNKNIHAGLFNGMINPILGYGIKGAIWYQGEQNRNEPDLYLKMFPAMVKQWRKDWGIGDFPFYYAQIVPYISRTKQLSQAALELQPYIPVLRESQLLAEKKIKNSGMAVLMDLGDEKSTIHPPDKQTVAERLSNYALAKTYKIKDVAYAGPSYKNNKIKGNQITLYFDNADGGLVLTNNKSQNFEIAGADKIFHLATPVVAGNSIILSSPQVSKPVAARYAFKAWTEGDLYNNISLPASSFRSDKWDVKKHEF